MSEQMADCVATRGFINTHRDVGRRRTGERFACPLWVAEALHKQGLITYTARQKPADLGKPGASTEAGAERSQSSSPAVQASSTKMSNEQSAPAIGSSSSTTTSGKPQAQTSSTPATKGGGTATSKTSGKHSKGKR